MCFPFFKAQGHAVGDSLCEEEGIEPARAALETAAARQAARCPTDLVLGDRVRGRRASVRELDGVDVPDGWMGLDIGPRTAGGLRRT